MHSKADRIQRRVNTLRRYVLAVSKLTIDVDGVSPTNSLKDKELPYLKAIEAEWQEHIQSLTSIANAQINKDQAKLDALEELLEGYE